MEPQTQKNSRQDKQGINISQRQSHTEATEVNTSATHTCLPSLILFFRKIYALEFGGRRSFAPDDRCLLCLQNTG